MAYTPFEGRTGQGESTINSKTEILSANGQELITVPSSDFVADAQMTKDGHDLVLEAPDGSVIIIEGYFLADPAPMIQSPDGSALTPQLVDSFAKAPAEFAQNGGLSDESPVGAVEEVSGEAYVIRADGTQETITIGTPIFQGDIIETKGDGAVNVVFMDETSFSVSDNARFAVDEYTFDPATESGTQNFSVLRGVFVFTSGLIGRDDPDDVEIDTPVGSIGIRGTIIAGDIQPGGESEITVIEGAIIVKNGFGEATLSQQFETVKLMGFDSSIDNMGVQPAQMVSQNYGKVSSVSPVLFSSINDAAQAEAADNNAGEQNADQPQGQEQGEELAPQPDQAAPEEVNQETQQEAEPQPNQPQQQPQQTAPDGSVQPINMDQPPADDMEPQADQPDASAPLPGTTDPMMDMMGDPMGTGNNFNGQNDMFDGQNDVMMDANGGKPPPGGVPGGTPSGTGPVNGTAVNSTPLDGNTQNTEPQLAAGDPLDATSEIPPVINLLNKQLFLNEDTQDGAIVARFTIQSNRGDVNVSFGNGSDTITSNFNYGDTTHTYTLKIEGNTQNLKDGQPVQIRIYTGGDNEMFDDVDVLNYALNYNLKVTSVTNAFPPKTFTFKDIVDNTDPVFTGQTINLNQANTLDNVTVIRDAGIGNQIGNSIAFGGFTSAGGNYQGGFDDLLFVNNIGQNNLYALNGLADLISTAPVIDNLGVDEASPNDFFTNLTSPESHNPVISNIGDINADGRDDFIISYNRANGQGQVFLAQSNPNPDPDSDPLTNDNPGQFINENSYDFGNLSSGAVDARLGVSVTALGDLDNDGFDDFAFSDSEFNGNDGAVYVYKGAEPIFLTNSAPQNATVLNGSANPFFGRNISSAGDFDGDGNMDLLVGSANTISLYAGNGAGGFENPSFIDDLDTETDNAGDPHEIPMGYLGDIDGDGLSDVLFAEVGTDKAFISFGNTSGDINGDINRDVLELNSIVNGKIIGGGAAGDFNGDGYDDVVLVKAAGNNVAEFYVLFGGDSATGLSLDNALKMTYNLGNQSPWDIDYTITGHGDLNGDGFDDIAIGMSNLNNDNVNNNGGPADDDGSVFIVYGDRYAANYADGNTATEDNTSLVGGLGQNMLSDGGHDGVSMNGGIANDTLKISNLNFLSLDGGRGDDTLLIQDGKSLDFSGVHYEKMSGIERISGEGNQTITLTLDNLFNLLKTSDNNKLALLGDTFGTGTSFIIDIDGDGTDDYSAAGTLNDLDIAANGGTGNISNLNVVGDADTDTVLTIGGYELYIDADVNVAII